MNHLEFAHLESAALEPTNCELWLDDVERLVGHDLDGDQSKDGYSLDGCVDMFDAGLSVAQAATQVQRNKAEAEQAAP